jgi:hypothetical protein
MVLKHFLLKQCYYKNKNKNKNMKNLFIRLKIKIHRNMNIFNINFVTILKNTLLDYIAKNNSYNFLVSLKITNRNNTVVLYSPFVDITINNYNYYKFLLHFLLNQKISNLKHIYFIVLKIPNNFQIIPHSSCFASSEVFNLLPKSMNRNDWDLMLLNYDLLQILEFKSTEAKGWLENTIHLLDLRSQEKCIIYDVREKNKDNNSSFLRRSNSYIIHYINGNIVGSFFIKNLPLSKNRKLGGYKFISSFKYYFKNRFTLF